MSGSKRHNTEFSQSHSVIFFGLILVECEPAPANDDEIRIHKDPASQKPAIEKMSVPFRTASLIVG
jgi:hypothetical protein